MNVIQMKREPENKSGASFAEFWAMYPRKVAKANAEKIFGRLPDAEKSAALETLPRHISYWRDNASSINYVPHAATWLQQKRFLDELECELPEAVFCKWPGCKSVGMKYYGKIACCDRHHDAYVRGLTP